MNRKLLLLYALAGPLITPGAAECQAHSHGLPTVDLGYEVHRALSFDETASIYNFSNIRYAESPVGDLRWEAPVAPIGRTSGIQDGARGRVCPQGFPDWFAVTSEFQAAFAKNQASSFNYSLVKGTVESQLASLTEDPYATTPYTTEDCLFLDVITPKKAFDQRDGKKLAPVLVWIHGGAYVTGNKVDGSAGNPSRLITESQEDGSDGIVYVALNYRLGGLGWLAGREFQANGGIPNLGLHDQRLALDWVQKNIHLFGGDLNRVTVSGGSAGAGSIIHHIIANNGTGKLPFQRAYIESPGWVPVSSDYQDEAAAALLNNLNVQRISEARKLPSDVIINANAQTVSSAKNTTFAFGPVVDGEYIPTSPGLAVRDGKFNTDVTILVSHTSNEGLTFLAPYVTTDESFTSYLQGLFPSAKPCDIDYIVDELYPLSAFNGSWYDRAISFVGDLGLKCNAEYLVDAFQKDVFQYEWGVFPAFHGQDFLHVFYDGEGRNRTDGSIIVAYANAFQSYLGNFVKNGSPNGKGLPRFPVAGSDGEGVFVSEKSIHTVKRDLVSEGCEWLRTAELWA